MSFLVVVFIVLLVYFTLQAIYRNIFPPWKNAPPGTPVVPFVGSGFSFKFDFKYGFETPAQTIHRLSKMYGPVMRMRMGDAPYVFLSGLKEIKEFSVMDATTIRPYNKTLLEMYSDGQPLGFGIGVGGERWKEQRKFAIKVLNDLSEGSRGMSEKIENEVIATIEDIQKRISNERECILRLDDYFDLPDLNVIWGLVAGTRYEFGDPQVKTQFDYLRSFLHEKAAGPLTAISWLKKVPPFSNIYWNIRRSMTKFREILSDVVEQQKKTFDRDDLRGYIDRFLNEQMENRGKYFTNQDLIINCQDLFIAGSETAASTLSFLILHMILRPDIQTRIQQEIDEHVGKERRVTLEDRSNLILTEATIMEVRRYSTPFPITPPRTSNSDLTIGGYSIPAGTTVQMNLFSVLRGEQYWENPDDFNPDRFIDSENKIIVPDAFIPFGFGKRRCLGEKLAIMSNFLFFSNLLQAFSFRCIDPSSKPTLRPTGGLTFGPSPFEAKITLRE